MILHHQVSITHPVKTCYALRLAHPLPRYVKKEDLRKLFTRIASYRDRAIFMVMLRCGLRVEEVANLTLAALDLPRRRLFLYRGKGAKDRVVYISDDAYRALVRYLTVRPTGAG